MIKLVENLRERITNLLTAPADELGRWANIARYQMQLWRFCARRLRRNNAMAMSAALSFRTIFALIPMLVLAVLLLKPLGYMEALDVHIGDTLSAIGIPQEVITGSRDDNEPTGETRAPRAVEFVMEDDNAPMRIELPGDDNTTPGARAVDDTNTAGQRRGGRRRGEFNMARFLERKVQQVEEKLTVGKVGPVGVLILIWTVMTLLRTMEGSLNRIFDAPRTRPFVRRIMIYWSVITLCPLLLATAIYMGHRTRDALHGVPVIWWLFSLIGWAVPVIVGVCALAAIYTLTTNTKVSFRAALEGAAIIIPLWLIAKWAFNQYVVYLVGPTKIYGTLGLLPLFLMWVNISWWLFLFGAEITHTLQDMPLLKAASDDEQFVTTPADLLAVMVTVAQRTASDDPNPPKAADIARALKLPNRPVGRLLDRLQKLGMVKLLDTQPERFYILAHPAERIVLADALEMSPARPETLPPSEYDPEIAAVVDVFRAKAAHALGKTTLADVMNAAGKKGEDA